MWLVDSTDWAPIEPDLEALSLTASVAFALWRQSPSLDNNGEKMDFICSPFYDKNMEHIHENTRGL